MDFDPRDFDDGHDRDHGIYVSRWGEDPRDGDLREVTADPRDHDPRDTFVRDLDLPRGLARELVEDNQGHLHELNGDDSRTLATIGSFRVVSERDLEDLRGTEDSLEHLRDEGLIRPVAIDVDERAEVLTDRGRDMLDAHRRDRDEGRGQNFHPGRGRTRELKHDSRLFHAYRKVEARLRDHGADVRRVVLERDLRREYQEFLQEHNRGRSESDGRPDRDAREIESWAREHDLPYFDEKVHFPDFRIEFELEGRDRHEDVEVLTAHYRGAHAASRARSGFTCFGGGNSQQGGSPFSPREREY